MATPNDRATFETVLRWMVENLEVASSVYRTPTGRLRVHSALHSNAQGHVLRRHNRAPHDRDDWLLNSATALLACCYAEALGKTLRPRKRTLGKKKPKKSKGARRGSGPNFIRFQSFVRRYMPDLVAECRDRGGRFSIRTFYKTYRNGFVHQFAHNKARWRRRGQQAPYWFSSGGYPGINVDRLAAGVIAAIAQFRIAFPLDARNGRHPYRNFVRRLDAD